MSSTLVRLQRWYKHNCDGDWEHYSGVTIGNIDNPGWSVTINLDGTPLATIPFQRVEFGNDDDNFDDDGKTIGPWWMCRVEEKWETDEDDGERMRVGLFWDACCDPDSLERVLKVFLDWAEANTPLNPISMP